ncbi:MAG: PTS fructose transporter subunit IIA [Lachnospiraceae bacterium]|nr:PTS fructose transporter subunit IIA [Lachnospiraceae bacterium]MDY5741667.1 PTS fructose transporter subunit IIA [Lachnospiraceae bacterium]
MIGLIVTGHGHFATGLGSALELIAGVNEQVVTVDFEADHTIETLTQNLNAAIDRLSGCDGVLVLSDLAGGSPFKTAVECKFARPELKMEVIAGTNLPLLIEGATMTEDFDCPKTMADELIGMTEEYIVLFELEVHEDAVEDDGI